ncbi:hypothetical protein GCM10007315_18480 [Gemmobacter tilapiae]|uniref:Uncharacterized protein n=1 Tax=Neogemmobacter tilapiae TaxID=875041 RepID=A0A918TPV5_9RHOB|nr:hypothetical protein GCM10007315_18480 [Gemmobacter tilapiae]
MLRRLATLSCIVGSSAVAEVDTTKTAMAQCAAIKGDLERLTCFDGLASNIGVDGPQPVEKLVGDVGKWQVERTKNPIDDTETVVLALPASQGQSGFGQPIMLLLRCQSKTFEMFVVWNEYLASDGDFGDNWKNIVVRHGEGTARTERWYTSTDQKATFAQDSLKHLKEMIKNESFVTQTTPYNSSPITAVFETNGISEAILPILDVCQLKL